MRSVSHDSLVICQDDEVDQSEDRPPDLLPSVFTATFYSSEKFSIRVSSFLRECPAWAVAPRGFAPQTVGKSII